MSDDIDRDLRRARFRALMSTRDPVRFARIDDKFDVIEAALLREAAQAGPAAFPASDFDAGRGASTDPPPRTRGHWTDALAGVLDER